AHTRGGTVARPLAWVVPADPRLADLYGQWLLGDALMVAPVLAPDTDLVEVHFPGPNPRSEDHMRTGDSSSSGSSSAGGYHARRSSGTWCRYSDLGDCYSGPSQHLIHSPLGAAPPLFLRAGCIIPTQPLDSTHQPAQPITTSLVAASPLTFIVLLSAAGSDDPRLKSESEIGSSSIRKSDTVLESTSAGSRARANITVPRDRRDDLVSYGLLYADNGTDTEVGGRRSLRAEMAAGSSLASGWGWMEYRVISAPETIRQVAEEGEAAAAVTVDDEKVEREVGDGYGAGAAAAAATVAAAAVGSDRADL
ncbi:hypothetical protein Vafri_526, partial [Volvox africanus]